MRDADLEAEQVEEINKELDRFEHWADEVRPYLGDPSYSPTFDEKRVAVLSLGLHATLYPASYGKRFEISVAPPTIMRILEESGIVQPTLP